MQEKIEKEEIWKKKEGRKVISSVEDELLAGNHCVMACFRAEDWGVYVWMIGKSFMWREMMCKCVFT